MWWGIGVAIALIVPLMVFYLFAATRLRTVARSAPYGANEILLSTARSFTANALQKIGIVVMVLFVGLREDTPGLHLLWMALVVVIPVAYMALEGRRRKAMESHLDAPSDEFMRTLDRIPVPPWQK